MADTLLDVPMLPVREIDRVTCMNLAGVVCDVDDTLTRAGRIEDVAYHALWQLREAGLRVVMVTGRPLGFAEVMARLFPVDLAVGENGAGYVRVTERGVTSGYFDAPEARAEQRRVLDRVLARMRRDAPWVTLADDQWARRCDLAFDIAERVHLGAEQVRQIVEIIESEGARALVSSVHAHAVAGRYDKASGTVRACRAELGADLDADRERWLFVGDSGNDAAAFAYFIQSAAVANVQAHLASLPVAPRYVSSADRGAGFAEIVAAVLERR